VPPIIMRNKYAAMKHASRNLKSRSKRHPGRLSFSPIRTTPHEKPHPVAMILELKVQDCPVDLLVDTGADGVLFFENRLRRRIPNLGTEGKMNEVMVRRQLRAKQTVLPGVSLGPRNLDLRVLLIKGPASDVLPGIDGYWGTASFKARRIDFNFARNKLSWLE
jgi:hypothetical protein